MKILHIVNDYFGTKLYSLLFQSLCQCGIENEIFVPIEAADHQKAGASMIPGEGNVIVSPCFKTIDRLIYFWKQKKIIKQIIELVDLQEVSGIHAHTLFSSGYAAMKLHEQYGLPYIVAIRNVDVNVFFKKIIWLRSIGIKILKDASKIVFLSPSYKKFVLEEYVPRDIRESIREKSEIIPNGISAYFLNNKRHKGERTEKVIRLIYAGQVNRNKNFGLTIKAARILKRQGIEVTLTCVGDVTDKACQKWVEDELVEYYPRCSQEELLKHYRHADIFVMPSRTETFGLVYAEAMSQGLPVIYTRGQGFDGQFAEGEVGFSTSDKDAKELARRISDVAAQYGRLSRNCLRLCEKFDWGQIAARYAEIYGSL